jgi:hypothetical protein
MKKVISFSLWGNKPMYTIGAIKNAELAKTIYPDFECWFYIHQDTVPSDIIEKLQEFDNTKIILKLGDLNNINLKPRMWRFEAIDDPEVEIMISRDTDTRFILREKLAVEEWLNSGKTFHMMRDHPCHEQKVMAGMFGTKKIPKISSWKTLIETFAPSHSYFYDQDFLRDYIYPHIKDDSVIHATFHQYESTCRRFPIKYCDEYRFVGEYVYEDESRNAENIQQLKTIVDKFRTVWDSRNKT